MGMRRYKLVLTATGPVHIGDGSEYRKKDYFDDKGKMAVLDGPAFVSKLDSHQVDAYCEFLIDKDARTSLGDFLGKHPDMKEAALKSVLYRINTQLSRAPRGVRRFHDVKCFVKDAYGKSYVPGSSVKGMLRTALVAALLEQRKGACADVVGDGFVGRACAGKLGRQIEYRVLRNDEQGSCVSDAQEDLMRYVSVSDSAPLSVDDLVFAKKYDLFSKNDPVGHKVDFGGKTDYDGNEIDIYRECLKPSTRMEFEVTIDDRVDVLFGQTVDAEFLLDALRTQEHFTERFLSAFDVPRDKSKGASGLSSDGRCCYVMQAGPLAGSRCRNQAVEGSRYCRTHADKADDADDARSGEDVTCFLGGGAGFHTKTILAALFDDDEQRVDATAQILLKQFPGWVDRNKYEHLYRTMREFGFEPKTKRARYAKNGKLIQAKEDHRHWRDAEFGVSPHTVKMGLIGQEKYLMGECSLTLRELQ